MEIKTYTSWLKVSQNCFGSFLTCGKTSRGTNISRGALFLSASDKDYVAIRDQNLISSFRGTKIGGFPKLLKNLGMGNYHPSQDGVYHMGKPVSRLRFPNPNIPIREFHSVGSGLKLLSFLNLKASLYKTTIFWAGWSPECVATTSDVSNFWSGFFLRNSFRRTSPKWHAILIRGGVKHFLHRYSIDYPWKVHSSRKFEFKFELTSQWLQWLLLSILTLRLKKNRSHQIKRT